MSGLTIDELIRRYVNVAIVVEPIAVARVVARDSDDDHVLACAVTAQADLIVSGDRHLLDLGVHQGIPICTAAAAVGQLVAPQP
jgi:putative PIN family toxin of toxin-antitoxin system